MRSFAHEPKLTEDEDEYTEVEQKARSLVFRSEVRKQYDNTYAICGSQRETPAGTPEVEAAHIYPKSEFGSDDPRKGLALVVFIIGPSTTVSWPSAASMISSPGTVRVRMDMRSLRSSEERY
ncbi:hypothetical protein [Halomicrococcus sp. NG-SE-24]|uniref:hypothetical protein n=1 Tax=Halomicrococcus sp. NG-SE-24 TaxID=3436928 RepID=UPI003D96C7EF